MLRTILLVMVMGCGTNGSDIHDSAASCAGYTTADGSAYNPPDGCEQACAMPPANYSTGSGDKCAVNGEALATCAYFTFEGVKGCCQIDGASARARIVFVECEAQ